MLTKEKIEEYKQKLEAERVRIEAEMDELDKPVDMSDNLGNREDEETDEAEEFSTNQGIAQPLKMEHEEVVAALHKIDIGGYGKCEKTGKDIEDEVLEVNPAARYCKEVVEELNEKGE
ncbi:MAG: hypothetical protein COU09_00355 [Candidatus Harrisonbacteria bacterium CG10_big_fil_rev_8_21_14_0_10_44_23]|uniref:Zinc finger DksA/TraR C4-type domain-containing protein n=1 Tax=Candidatus Harrisonbacteria bacterium CG10_big_fil_rev_8_21_14_0_10_44_23 TaxID=1974585 RepID=A0A2H0UQU5_9BACT|nr:MAG: hypothetical protein COU09_00355 [Candidatus Harrisonbacteria bacterium CG10_big_fil_rev_8_21_14_0_10_44_23]